MAKKVYQIIVRDIRGNDYRSQITEWDDVVIERLMPMIENFGNLETFSMIDTDGYTMGFNPRNCIFATLHTFDD